MGGVARETSNLKATPNTNLTWSESEIFNVGLAADLWNGVLGFELDVFRCNRHGLMATRTGTIPDWLREGLAPYTLHSYWPSGFSLLPRHRNTIYGNLYFLQSESHEQPCVQ